MAGIFAGYEALNIEHGNRDYGNIRVKYSQSIGASRCSKNKA
jgi:hypothetical protein